MAEPGFIFGKGTPWTYEQLQRKRQIADALAGQIGTPRNVGEGLTAIGKALASRGLNRRADKRDAELKGEFDQQWSGMFSGGVPSSGMPMGGGAITSAHASPPDPNNPVKIGADTMAALGKEPNYSFDTTGVTPAAMKAFASLEGAWGQPLTVNSAYRTPEHNAKVGGAKDSQHTHGNAFDVDVSGMSEEQRLALTERAKASGFKGVGVYDNSLHFDVGPERAWGADYTRNSLPAWAGGAVSQPSGDALGGPSFDIGTLAEIAGNPYASPGQKAIVSALMQQQMDALDPMRRIELQKAQLELAQMQNPQAVEAETFTGPDGTVYSFDPVTREAKPLTGAKPGGADMPAAFASLDLQAKAAGLQPGTPEYQDFMLKGGGSGAPAAFVALDLQAKAAGFNPGTPEYQEFMATRGAGLIAEAKLKGEDAALLDSQKSKMEGLETVVSELNALADQATYTGVGQAVDFVGRQLGIAPRDAAVARSEYISKVDNQVLPMLRDTFGAAFTMKEGETLRATLGDPNKTPQEKKAVLRAFIDQKKRDIDALQKRTGRPTSGTTYTFNPATGELE